MAQGVGFWRASGVLALVLSVFGACKRESPSATTTPTAESLPTSASQPQPQPKAAVTVVLAYGSEKKSWLTDAIERFNDKTLRLPSGEQVRVEGQAVGSGAAVEDLGSVVEPPPGPVIRNLMELWSRQIGR